MIEILINQEKNLKTIMLVNNGILLERHEEHENQKRLEGNIYLGVVKDIIPGMQSAFIDIGEEKNAIIKVKELLPRDIDANRKAEGIEISDLLKPQQKILIQIKKDGTLTKGAKVSTHVNLPGRFIALLPDADYITISQKIENNETREKLKSFVATCLPKGIGAIIRTASKYATTEQIKQEIDILLEEWGKIKEKEKLGKEKLLYDNNALIRRTIIDIIDRGLDRIVVNDKNIYEKIKQILTHNNINIETVLKENEDLLKMYSIEEQVKKMSYRKIWLACGGFITIDKTEALTAIDVNTGKYIGKKSKEDTVFTVNKEATIEIAKQLRLRDIGGIIIIDYIDMFNEENKKNIESLLKQELNKDRTKCQIEGFTKLNLLEMTRKNMCNNDWDNKGEEKCQEIQEVEEVD